jgi:hypothetical protein
MDIPQGTLSGKALLINSNTAVKAIIEPTTDILNALDSTRAKEITTEQ